MKCAGASITWKRGGKQNGRVGASIVEEGVAMNAIAMNDWASMILIAISLTWAVGAVYLLYEMWRS